jgi:hypothetical protein
MIGKHQAQRVLVIHRHGDMAAQIRELRLRRHQGVERHHELIDPPKQHPVVQPPPIRDADAKVLPRGLEHRLQVSGRDPVADRALGVDPPAQDRSMRRVDLAFQRLQPVHSCTWTVTTTLSAGTRFHSMLSSGGAFSGSGPIYVQTTPFRSRHG